MVRILDGEDESNQGNMPPTRMSSLQLFSIIWLILFFNVAVLANSSEFNYFCRHGGVTDSSTISSGTSLFCYRLDCVYKQERADHSKNSKGSLENMLVRLYLPLFSKRSIHCWCNYHVSAALLFALLCLSYFHVSIICSIISSCVHNVFMFP